MKNQWKRFFNIEKIQMGLSGEWIGLKDKKELLYLSCLNDQTFLLLDKGISEKDFL